MSRDDRAVRRASRWLADEESLVASAAGIEADGRRHAAVLVTDRRVLVVWSRTAHPLELTLDDATAQRSDPGALLSVAGPGVDVTLRAVDPDAAAQVVAVLEEHRPRPQEAYAEKVAHVRIISRLDDEGADRYLPLDDLTIAR